MQVGSAVELLLEQSRQKKMADLGIKIDD